MPQEVLLQEDDPSIKSFLEYLFARYQQMMPLSPEEEKDLYTIYVEQSKQSEMNWLSEKSFQKSMTQLNLAPLGSWDKNLRKVFRIYPITKSSLQMALQASTDDSAFTVAYVKIGTEHYRVTTRIEKVK